MITIVIFLLLLHYFTTTTTTTTSLLLLLLRLLLLLIVMLIITCIFIIAPGSEAGRRISRQIRLYLIYLLDLALSSLTRTTNNNAHNKHNNNAHNHTDKKRNNNAHTDNSNNTHTTITATWITRNTKITSTLVLILVQTCPILYILQLTRFTNHSGSIDSGRPNFFHIQRTWYHSGGTTCLTLLV